MNYKILNMNKYENKYESYHPLGIDKQHQQNVQETRLLPYEGHPDRSHHGHTLHQKIQKILKKKKKKREIKIKDVRTFKIKE